MSYLSDFKELNGGYVAFGDLKFNLFSVSQMCDKKNNVLFTDTECLVLSSDFKLPDASQVLLRVPRENNMYNVNLKNIIPSNFKTINKLVKGDLVRGKFDGKADEGFFVGYSTNSKAFRVFNSRSRIVEENMHVKF
nr:ribonuclease H-like domain-containing protein [Tanacetum cinerariifolium]